MEACLLEHLDDLSAGCKDFFDSRALVITSCADARKGLPKEPSVDEEYAQYRAWGDALSSECARALATDPRFGVGGGAPPPTNQRLGAAPPPMQAQREVSKNAPAGPPPGAPHKFAEKMGNPPLAAKGLVSDRKANFGASVSEHARAKSDKAANAPGAQFARAVPEGAINPKRFAANKAADKAARAAPEVRAPPAAAAAFSAGRKAPGAPEGRAPPTTAEGRRAALVERVAKKVPKNGARAAPNKLDKPVSRKDARSSGPTDKPTAERREASRAAPSDFGKMSLRGLADNKPVKA